MTKAFKVSIAAPSFVKSGGTSNQYLMADGSVTTGGSTTSMNYAQTQSAKVSNISASGVTIVSANITTGGNPVQILVTGDAENTVAGGWIRLQLFRGTTAIGKGINVESSAASENIPYAITVIDTPTAGTYTYSLQTVTAAATGAFNFGEVDGPVLTAIELNTLTPTTNLSLTGTVSADQVAATNNGNGTNFKVGDDVWIGDINVANTMSIKGQGSASLGYIRLGSDTNAFGYNGTNLVYGTTIIPSTGGTLATTGQTFYIGSQAITINQGTGTITSLPGVTSINGTNIPLNGTLLDTTSTTSALTSFGNSPVLITPKIDTINTNTGAATTAALWSDITTGSISIGSGVTSGSISIGNANQGTSITKTVNIMSSGSGSGTMAVNIATANGAANINIGTYPGVANSKTINIGTSSTGGTTAITIGSNSGATSTIQLNGSITLGSLLTAGFVKTSAAGLLSVDTNTYITGSAPTINNLILTGTVTANSSVGTSGQVLTSTGTGVQWSSASGGYTPPDIIPLDNLQYKFDGVESRFRPTYQGVTQSIANPFRLLLSINGIIQSISLPEYVWGTPFTMDGFMVDSDGYIAFSEVPPAGSTFFGQIQAGPTTQSSNNTYPFKAMDILLGAY